MIDEDVTLCGKLILESPPFRRERLDRALGLLSVTGMAAIAILFLMPFFVEGDNAAFIRSALPIAVMLGVSTAFFLWLLVKRRRSRPFIFYEKGFQHHSLVKLRDGTRSYFIPYDRVKDVRIRTREIVLEPRFAKYASTGSRPPAFTVTIRLTAGTRIPVSWQTFGREWMKPQEFLESMSNAFRMFLAMREMIAHSNGGPEGEKKARSLAAPSADVTAAAD